MSNVMYAGRKRYAQLVRLYMYDRDHVEKDGEPLGYVRTVATREKKGSYNLFGAVGALQEQMQIGNWVGCSQLPALAYRILPNMYLHTAPVNLKIYNFTVIYKPTASHLYYLYNLVHNCADVPSRREMMSNAQTVINTKIQPIIVELYQIQNCLCDAWANVGTEISQGYTLWLHLKQIHAKKFVMPQGEPRDLEDIIDNAEPGDSYLRTKFL